MDEKIEIKVKRNSVSVGYKDFRQIHNKSPEDLTEQEKIVRRMLELEIYPFRATVDGQEVLVYTVDEEGFWYGTKNKTIDL